jgi:hypothetical protein
LHLNVLVLLVDPKRRWSDALNNCRKLGGLHYTTQVLEIIVNLGFLLKFEIRIAKKLTLTLLALHC